MLSLISKSITVQSLKCEIICKRFGNTFTKVLAETYNVHKIYKFGENLNFQYNFFLKLFLMCIPNISSNNHFALMLNFTTFSLQFLMLFSDKLFGSVTKKTALIQFTWQWPQLYGEILLWKVMRCTRPYLIIRILNYVWMYPSSSGVNKIAKKSIFYCLRHQ